MPSHTTGSTRHAALGLALAALATACLATPPQGTPGGPGPEGAPPPPEAVAGPGGPPGAGPAGAAPPPEGQAGGPPPPGAPDGKGAQPSSEPSHQLSATEIEEFLTRGIAVGDLEGKIAHGVEIGAVTLPMLGSAEEKARLVEKGVPQALIDAWSAAPVGSAPSDAPAPTPGG